MSLRERKPLFTKELTTEKYGRRKDGSKFERIEIFMKEDVNKAVAELLKWCNRYRTSNELWKKSQDENLMDFEDKIKEVFE